MGFIQVYSVIPPFEQLGPVLHQCWAGLCCAVLSHQCSAVPYFKVLCYILVYYTVQLCAVLCCTVLCYAVQLCAVLCSAIQCSAGLGCAVQCSAVLYLG